VIWDERETRLVGACVAASVVLHAAALALGPHLRRTHIEPPQVLRVVIAELQAPEPRVQEPLAPPPPPRPEIPRARARVTPAPLPRREPEPTTASRPEPAVVPSEAPTTPADAPTAPAVQPAPPAVAARESLVAPDFRAAYLNNPPPAYPRIARRNGEQGTVTLRVHVRTDGVPAQVELERSSGSNALDLAALETVKNWRFAPARRAGDPVAAWVIVPVVFRLTSGS
jgi:periplasmic protein TonB